MEVYASSFGEVFSLPLPIAQGTGKKEVVISK
jgi:hypothetical protein